MIGNEPPESSATPDIRRIVHSQAIANYSIHKSFARNCPCAQRVTVAYFSLKRSFKAHGLQENQAAETNGELANSVHPSAIRESSRGGPLIVNPIGEMMTADEVAEYLRVNRTMIYRLLKRKELPGFKIGTDFRLRRVDVDEWIIKKEQTAWMHRARL
jgi:excisionase family DNA binding protein